MSDIRSVVREKLIESDMAQTEWEFLKNFVELEDNERVVFFPERDERVNHYGMLYLDTYLMRNDAKKAVVIYQDASIKEQISNYSDNVRKCIFYELEKMNRFLTLYALYPIDSRIAVVSLEQPYLRNGSRLLGVNDITVEQLVAIGVYAIIPFDRIQEG